MSVELEDVPPELRPAVGAALDAAGVSDGHLSVELVDAQRIQALNREHRGRDAPTDVLAFPLDGPGPVAGPRELGDVVICPEHAADVVEAAVHGVLHLCGYDHERDDGEMLALQERVLAGLRAGRRDAGGSERAGSRPRVSAQGPGGEPEAAAGDDERPTRAGFVGLAGRPNVGKSTLVNAIVGAKVAIISDRPQTTRRAARGIATDTQAGWQLVLVDLPGVQRPRDVLTERMQRRVERELADADLVLLVINGEQGVGPGDRFIARTLLGAQSAERAVPVICAVNKCDRLDRARTAEVLMAAAELEGVDEVFPVSARTGAGVGPLVEALAERLPEGPFLYPPEERSDAPSDVHLAELIREQILRRTHAEIPHAVEVRVESARLRPDGIHEIHAQVWVETPSQKAILIGRGGRMVREVGSAARRELERELGGQVFLDLQVRVRDRWRRDEGLLDRLGIE